MRRARATRRQVALRAALVEARAAASSADADVDASSLDAALQRRLREADAQPLWPPAEAARLLRARQWVCLLANDTASGALAGCMVLSWRVPDAALPAPFPSFRPQKLYISNMGVAPAARRRGVARALLRAAEELAAAWEQDEVVLHVDAPNSGARALYEACGYTLAAEGQDPWFVPAAQRRLLLHKALPRSRWCKRPQA